MFPKGTNEKKSKLDYKSKKFDVYSPSALGLCYLTENDINDNKTMTLEKIENISRYLGNDEILKYRLYLKLNPHLPNDEKEYYEEYIKVMEHNTNLLINKMLDIYKDNECKE